MGDSSRRHRPQPQTNDVTAFFQHARSLVCPRRRSIPVRLPLFKQCGCHDGGGGGGARSRCDPKKGEVIDHPISVIEERHA
ncbi:hypothetical protein MRX96_027715 [Rhipicephalus microplus]